MNPTRDILRTSMSELHRPGESELSGAMISRIGQVALTLVVAVTNLIGAAAVFVIAYFVVPLPAVRNSGHVEQVNAIVAAIYVAVAVPVGVILGTWRLGPVRKWLREDRPPSLAETRLVLLAPAQLFSIQVALWFAAAILFALVNGAYDSHLGVRVGIVVALTGLVTAACAYLLSERLLRPAAARALAQAEPGRLAVPGVATRAVLAWLLSTGLPVGGVVVIGVLGLSGDPTATTSNLGLAMVALGGTAIAVGLLATVIAARATADPINSVRRALAEVQQGEFDVRVPVYDGTQIGQLQLGFNRMVEGLAERERIRNAFGTYVDPDVAEHILEEGTNLAGEHVEVTLMFVDICDFTGFAEDHSADEVVAAINDLFEQMVPVVHEHDGRVDKFIGDGLLAVFGAPRRLEDHADKALSAALQIARETTSEAGLTFGIGLNSGTVVAGNVGGEGRLEFSVIGDPVNVAARVEAATRQTDDKVLLTETTKELLGEDHPELTERPDVELKGKQERVRVYAPAETASVSANGETTEGAKRG